MQTLEIVALLVLKQLLQVNIRQLRGAYGSFLKHKAKENWIFL